MLHWLPHLRARRPASARLRAWLQAPGSLTANLVRSLGDGVVRRVFQGGGRLRRDEAQALGMAPGRRVHVREVALCCQGRPLVVARSVTASQHLRGAWRALLGLGTRPLAELLFQQRDVMRAPLQFARLPRHRWEVERLKRRWRSVTDATVSASLDLPAATATTQWARRSVYTRRGGRLLVMEVFDPQFSDIALRGAPRGARKWRPMPSAAIGARASARPAGPK